MPWNESFDVHLRYDFRKNEADDVSNGRLLILDLNSAVETIISL